MVWLDKLIRGLFALIDGVIGWAIGELYALIILIANVDVFGDYIYEFMGRIYTFLGIFMLFKLSISVVNYILNPDQLTDKTKGFGKIIQQVIIVMGLIIMTPQIFKWAYKLQALILNNNVIYTLVTGTKNDGNYSLNSDDVEESVDKIKKNAEETGALVKYNLLSGFIYREDAGNVVSAEKEDGKECDEFADDKEYQEAFDCLLDGDTYNNTKSSKGQYGAKNKFVNEYKVIVSTICLGFTAYVFLVTAFDVALRAVKLGFLELIAPIPIISMLDPNSAKSGMFSKWFKECKNNYLSLFTRLLVVYFAIEMINQIFDDGSMKWRDTGVTVNFGFVKIFIVLGLLMFVKQLPKFIEDALGIKTDVGGLSLKKKLDSIPGSKAVAGAIGFGGGIAANTIAAYKNGNTFGQGLRSAVAGGFSGAFRGVTSKEKNALKAGRGAIKGAVDKRNLRDQRQATGYTLGRRVSAAIDTFAGLDPMEKFDNEIKQYEDVEKQASAILSRANGEMIKNEKIKFKDDAGNTVTMRDFKVAKEYLSALRNADTSHMTDSELISHTEEINRLQNSIAKTEKLAEQAYIDAVLSNDPTVHVNDDQITAMVSGLKNTISSSSNETISTILVTNGKSIKDIKDTMGTEKVKTTNSDEYKRAVANKKSK